MGLDGETVWNPVGAGLNSETAGTPVVPSVVSCKQGSALGHSDLHFDLVLGKPALSQDSGVCPNRYHQGHSSLVCCIEAQDSSHEDTPAVAVVVLEGTVAEMVEPELPMEVLAAKS